MIETGAMQEQVILVDENDRALGIAEKLIAHREGRLHRAFSIFIFNASGEMLLQRRALHKYHSAGLWTNACCSHPRPGESLAQATRRRLREEMGFECPLHPAFQFIYRAELEYGLIEHEYDHVFIGDHSGELQPDPREVMDHRWLSLPALAQELQTSPENYTVWFRIAAPRAVRSRGLPGFADIA